MKKSTKTNVTTSCFYCGADSSELKILLILIVGGMVISSLLVFIGLYTKGAFKNTEDLSVQPMESENE